MAILTRAQILMRKVDEEINRCDEKYIMKVDLEDFEKYFLEKYCDPILEKDPFNNPTYDPSIPYHSRGIPHVEIQVRYPLVPKERIKSVVYDRPSKHTYRKYSIGFLEEESSLRVVAREILSSKLEQTLKEIIETIETQIRRWNEDTEKINQELREYIRNRIMQQKAQFEKMQQVLEKATKSLPFTITRRVTAPQKTPDVKKRSRIELPKIKQSPPQEWMLTRKQLNQFLDDLNFIGFFMAQTPKTFRQFKEKGLRDIVLAILNGLYEGYAMSEAWSKLGRTDIKLVIPEGTSLIIECKLWYNQSYYKKSIDQLFKYLTWYNNYGFILTFCLDGDFSEVLKKAKESTLSHKTIASKEWNLYKKIKTHAFTKHAFPGDTVKQIEIHHLFFNMTI